jgi:hypothetical protein
MATPPTRNRFFTPVDLESPTNNLGTSVKNVHGDSMTFVTRIFVRQNVWRFLDTFNKNIRKFGTFLEKNKKIAWSYLCP